METCAAKVDLCFVIDSSGSIRDNNPSDGSYDNWKLQLEFVASLIDAFTVGLDETRIGAIVFSEQVIFEFALDRFSNGADMKAAVNGFAYLGGTTNTPAALTQTRTDCFNAANGDRPDVDNLAIIITDGVPFPPTRRQPALDEAKALRETGASVTSVGISDNIDEAFLKDMSSSPQLLGHNYFKASDFTALDTIRHEVVQGTCDSLEGKLFLI